jgi:basic amino acid/polyamine antiporter, APA family
MYNTDMDLKKELRLLDIFCIATGAMISSGLFVLPGLAFARTGPSVFVAYFLAGILALTGMVSTIELTTAMPKAGGNYFFTTRSLGPAVGTIAGLLSWFSLGLKSAFALVGMSAFTVLIVPMDTTVIAVVLCGVFIVLNLVGVKEASRFQIVLVLLMMVLMIVYTVVGMPSVQIQRFDPFVFRGFHGVLATAGFVFVSYGGLLHIASVAEEVRDPKKNIPAGMIASLVIVSIAYSFVVLVTVGVLDPDVFSASLTPISDGAAAFMGQGGMIALSVAAILAFISTANAGLLSSSRYLFALGRDQLLPGFFTSVNRKFKTPHWAVLVTGAFMIVVLLLPLEILVQSASTVLMLTYILSNLSVIVLRESRIVTYKPSFRSPLYPWLQILGSIGFMVLIFEMGLESLLITLVLITVGFLVYLFYGKRKSSSEFALMHIVQRLFTELPFLENKRITNNVLESELRHIIHDRDEVIEDAFDTLVHDSLVLDIPDSMTMDSFFQEVAGAARDSIGLSDHEIYNLLWEREKLASTVLSPFLAVPHIVIPGEKRMCLLIARMKNGVAFEHPAETSTDAQKQPPSVPEPGATEVKAAFVIFGTRDHRNLHLKVLASIAQIVQHATFEKLWLEAVTPDDLKHILLLGERKR